MKNYAAALYVTLLGGCAHEWRDMPDANNLPLINSEPSIAKYARTGCIGCASGYSSEVYFFSSAKKIAKDSICEDAKELISPHFKGTNWQEADSYFDKTKRYFTNSRIYVVSASPMIVAVVPWKYKTHPKDPFYWHKISEKIHDFHMGTKETKAPQFCWIVGSKNMIELRSTFPAEPTSAQIISGESKIQINLPAKPGEFADIKIEEIDYSMEKTVTGEIRFRKKQ